MPRRRLAASAAGILAAVATALGACADRPPADPPRAACVLGEAAADRCVLK